MTAFTDVTQTDCPHCKRLICTDYLTCPGYLRDLCNRLEGVEPVERGERQPIGVPCPHLPRSLTMNSPDARHISEPSDPSQLSRDMRPDSGVEPDGICHCDPRPESSPIGECPRCHRLDPRKAYA